MTFDPTKPVQTRDGRKARIICTDRVGIGSKIIALILEGHGEEAHAYKDDGSFWYADECHDYRDLINIPPLTLREGGVYRTRDGRQAFVSCVVDDNAWGMICGEFHRSKWAVDGSVPSGDPERTDVNPTAIIAEWVE